MLGCLGVCLFDRLYPINVKTAEPIGPKFFVGHLGTPGKVYESSNICLHQNSIVIKFFKILKIREIFCENPRIIFVLFYEVHKENMFTINLEDGREAPSKTRKKGAKRLEFLVYINRDVLKLFIWFSLIYLSIKYGLIHLFF